MSATLQEQVVAISAHLDLFLGPGEFEYIVNELTALFKSKANTSTMKQHIIAPINALIYLIHRMTTAQKMQMDFKSNWIIVLEKSKKWKKELEDTIDSKIEESLDNLFDNEENFESKVQNVVKSLLKSDDFTYHLWSIIFGNTNFYAKVTTLINLMVENSALHHPETDFSPIFNVNLPVTGNLNPISNSNNTQSNTNVNCLNQQQHGN